MDYFNSHSQNYDKVEIPSELPVLTEEKQIIIHCFVKGETVLSIRPDCFLMSNKPHRKSFLLFNFGVLLHPKTSYGIDQTFTLIFGSLDKDCRKFNFIEGKLHEGMFLVQDIIRTEDDVYHITFGE